MPTPTQQELNNEMTSIGISRYRTKIERARERKQESDTAYSQRLIRGVLPKFIEYIDYHKTKWKKRRNRAQWQTDLLEMPSEKIGFLTLRTVLDQLSQPCKMTGLSVRVGTVIDYQRRCDHMAKHSPKGEGIILGAIRLNTRTEKRNHVRKGFKRDVEDGIMEDKILWDRRTVIAAGFHLIQYLEMSTQLIEYKIITETGRKNGSRFVAATAKTLKWIRDFNDYKELATPQWLPSVDVPIDWDRMWHGGYDTENTSLPANPFIKTADREFLQSIDVLEMPMEACNLIQKTPWEVNMQVFEVMKWAWENSVKVGGLPHREEELVPPPPTDYDDNKEANLEWRIMACGIHRRNVATVSHRLRTARLLYLIEKMAGSTFYYPSHCDFRGRIYNIPILFSIQGPDVCRGALRFARSKPIETPEARKWLAIQGANTWGYDKVSLDDRVKWADEFAEDAIKIADNPTRVLLWTDADEPWQFLAWCFEWATLQRTGKLNSHLPVNLDATNNGVQILSMLTRDAFGMKATNVLPTETPADIYAVVAKLAVDRLQKEADKGSALSAALIKFGVDRKTTKKSVMCYSYGMTQYSNRHYIADWYDDQIHKEGRTRPFDDSEKYIAVHLLAKAIREAIESILEKPKECMKWFQDCSTILTKAKHPLQWTTSSGFVVKQKYHNYTHKQIQTHIDGVASSVRYLENSDELSNQKQRNGVSPNFVHSLDATALHKTVIRAHKELGINDFAMIHDSYGVHAADCEEFSKLIRDVFVGMFSVDLLRDWKQQLESYAGVELPEPPEYGTADINEIHNSQYFFS